MEQPNFETPFSHEGNDVLKARIDNLKIACLNAYRSLNHITDKAGVLKTEIMDGLSEQSEDPEAVEEVKLWHYLISSTKEDYSANPKVKAYVESKIEEFVHKLEDEVGVNELEPAE